MKKCVIVYNNYNYFKGFESVPLFGRIPVWVSAQASARVFESKASAKDILSGYWFDSIRKRCSILTVEE